MNTKKIENLQYFILVLLILGQVTIGWSYILGQSFYLIGNVLSTFRTFVLKRSTADKVKDICFLALTIGLMIIKFI